MSFYGTESDVVRKRFTPSAPSAPSASTIEMKDSQELKLASEKRELLDLKTQVNTVKVVDSTENSGFYCSACKITLKDSSSYLDHVNSRAHARNLGLEMRVEKATLEKVQARIELYKKKLKEPRKDSTEIIQEKRKLQLELDLQKKQERKSRKLAKSLAQVSEKEIILSNQDPMFKVMGFSDFNSSKK